MHDIIFISFCTSTVWITKADIGSKFGKCSQSSVKAVSYQTQQSKAKNYDVGSHRDGSLAQHVARLISVWDTDLDGGPGEAAQLFDVLPFLSNDGPYSLRWDVHMDCLLLWSLNTHMRHKLKNQQQAQQSLSPSEFISEETTHVSVTPQILEAF